MKGNPAKSINTDDDEKNKEAEPTVKVGAKRPLVYGKSDSDHISNKLFNDEKNVHLKYETPVKKMRKLGDSDNGILRASEKNRLPIVKGRERAESDGAQSYKDCEDL